MELKELYRQYKNACGLPYKKGDAKSGENYRLYQKLKKQLSDALLQAYADRAIHSEQADELSKALYDERLNPVSFWGSEKFAATNHPVFVADMSERLFEELLKCYESMPRGLTMAEITKVEIGQALPKETWPAAQDDLAEAFPAIGE